MYQTKGIHGTSSFIIIRTPLLFPELAAALSTPRATIWFLNSGKPRNSAASRCILVPFEWYGCPKKCAHKVCVTFFLYIFQVKTKWNIVYNTYKRKSFQETQITFLKCIEHQIFLDTLRLQPLGFFEYH